MKLAFRDLYRSIGIWMLLLAAGPLMPTAWAAPAVTLNSPAPNSVWGDKVTVSASVASSVQVQSVKAKVGAVETNLTLVPLSGAWGGDLPLTGFPHGSLTLEVTATDTGNETGTAQVTIQHNAPPQIQITSPKYMGLARPQLHIVADCTDDVPNGCVELTVSVLRPDGQTVEVGSGTNHVDVTTTLNNEGLDNRFAVIFTAPDNEGATRTVRRPVLLETNTTLQELTQVDGEILDADSTRILFVVKDEAGNTTLSVRDRSTGSDTAIATVPGEIRQAGFGKNAYLTPQGGLFVTGTPDTSGNLSAPFTLYEWKTGQLLFASYPPTIQEVDVTGRYAAWLTTETDPAARLTLRDLATGAEQTVATDAANVDMDVAENGDIVFWKPDFQVYRYRNGAVTALTNDNNSQFWNVSPKTDGNLTVYIKSTPCCHDQMKAVFMNGTSGEVLLAPGTTQEVSSSMYDVNGGWIVYPKAGTWLRPPSGPEKKIDDRAVTVEQLGPNGDVAYRAIDPDNTNQALYLNGYSRTGPLRIGSRYGHGFYMDGQWHFSYGNTLFTVPGTSPAVTADPQSNAPPEDTALPIVLTGSSTSGGTLTFTVQTPPTHGTLSGAAPNLTYTPAADFNGSDSFTFRVSDGAQQSDPATISINVTPVNDPPVAQPLTHSGLRDRPMPVTLAGSDVDGGTLTYTVVAPPGHGALTGTAPNLTFTPEPGYSGPDFFTYKVSDGSLESAAATVNLTLLIPHLEIGSATVEPGESAEVAISTTEAAVGVAGLELILSVTGPSGVPLPTPTFLKGAATQDWVLQPDPNNPWRVTIAGAFTLQGAHELLRVRLAAGSTVPAGTVFRLEAHQAVFTAQNAAETDVTGFTAPGALTVAACVAQPKGDSSGDGTVNIEDVILNLRFVVGLEAPPNDCARTAADTNCDGLIRVGDAVLILRHIVFGEGFTCS